jgi:hypothetical protein
MFLLNHIVAAGRGAHLLVVDVSQARHFSDRGSVTLELIGMDDLWDVVFTQQSGEEGFCRFGILVLLKKKVEHETVLVYRTPHPIPDTSSRRTDINQRPLGTPAGCLVTQCISEQGTEWAAPLAERLVADLNTALIEQFLNILVTERKAVVQPDGVLDDGHGKAVAVRLGVRYGGSAYPDAIKATQPFKVPRSPNHGQPAALPGAGLAGPVVRPSQLGPEGRGWRP